MASKTEIEPFFESKPTHTRVYTNNGLSWLLLAWPLFVWSGFVLLSEFILYIFVRLCIKIYEFVRANSKNVMTERRKLYYKMNLAQNYEEWKGVAEKLDIYEGRKQYISQTECAYYDYNLVSLMNNNIETCVREIKSLQSYHPQNQTQQLEKDEKLEKNLNELQMFLRSACINNFAGIENRRIYAQAHCGGKAKIDHFLRLVSEGIQIISDCPRVTPEQKQKLFTACSKAYGQTALCLSGGAARSLYHLGVIKCLSEQDLLPSVISGTSGGAYFAAMVCTRTREEFDQVLSNPKLLENGLRLSDESWITILSRLWQKGYLLDPKNFLEKIRWATMGDMTFLEAYKKTGRVLNITVTPEGDKSSQAMNLNYRTTPNVLVWSAVIASAALPVFIGPAELYYKNSEGAIKPFHSLGTHWRDGSYKIDIPTVQLQNLFNVQFCFVSQVNPHISFFYFETRGGHGVPHIARASSGFKGGFVLASLELWIKLDMRKWLKFMSKLDLTPRLLGQESNSVFLQKFDGNITLIPPLTPTDLLTLVVQPKVPRIVELTRIGRQLTYPKVLGLEKRLRLEQKLGEKRFLWGGQVLVRRNTGEEKAEANDEAVEMGVLRDEDHEEEQQKKAKEEEDDHEDRGVVDVVEMLKNSNVFI